ncbi:MAG TPA: phage tail protein [Massilia sp.]|nr:phage tail protein [Massilia sp.]
MSELAVQLLRRKAALEQLRTPHEQVWRDCFDYSFPERGDGFNGEKSDATALQAKRARLMDSTSTDAGQILAAAIMSGGTPSNSRWFGLSTGQDTDEEKRWFDLCAETIFENIHGSNFDAVGFEACTDMVPAGWFVLFIDVDRELGGYHFELWPMASCYIAASKSGGLPDTLVRSYELSAEQAIKDFGRDQVSEKVRKLVDDGKPDEKVRLCQSIYPRSAEATGVRAKNLAFASVHIEVDTKHLVRESGFHECPFVAPRWAKLPNSEYAIGPMFRALPDIKQLNRLVYLEDTNLDMAVSGMWIAEDDGVLNPRTVKVGPRKIIVANSVDSMKALQSGAKFDLSFTKKEQLQAAIRKTLMADQLTPQDGPVRSATEVHVRVQMIRQLLGPIYGRMQAEWYAPMISRCFGLAMRAGVLPPPPQSLAGRQYNVKFESPNAKAQKIEEVNAVETSLVAVGQIAEARQDPSVWDAIDIDESISVILEGRGAPARIGRSKEEIQAIREQRAQAQQQAQQQQQQAEMAQKMAPQMAKNMAPA